VKRQFPTWVWLLLAVVGFGGLLVVVWADRDLTKMDRLADTQNLRTRVERMAGKYLATRTNGALVIGVVQKGRTHWLGFGRVSSGNNNPPDDQTLFELGSVTKVFTGIALARLVDDGRLKLDDTLGNLLPAEVKLPAELQPITLVQLATHTAGLPRLPSNLDLSPAQVANPYVNYTRKDLYDYLGAAKLNIPPGTKSTYSNLGVGLLGHILELRAGVPYEQLLRKLVLSPLNLTHTAITLSPELRERLTPGHDARGNVVSNWDFAVLAPAGALRSCAADALKFVQANLATPPGPALALAQKTFHEAGMRSVGLCWQIQDVRGVYRFYWHNGGTGGYVSFVGFDRDHQTGVVLLSNYGDAMAGDNSLDGMGMDLLKLAAKVSWD